MFLCRRRHRKPLTEEEQQLKEEVAENVLDHWERIVRRARRLGHKRRLWAFLGHHLREIKKLGQ